MCSTKYILIGFLFLFFSSWGQEMRIGVYRSYDIQRIDCSYHNGSYIIHGDSLELGAILPNEYVSLRKTNDGKVELKHGVILKGRFDKVRLVPTKRNLALRLDPKAPAKKQRRYQDQFEIFSGSKGLTIVNVINMDHYLSGVVESEGGGGKHLEYYKAQAVISRTYALKHINRHQSEGFNLCDRVHCQAYHNMLIYTPKIREAVTATSGEHIKDTVTNQLVDGYFHANCGGQTSSSDYVWNKDTPYLQPFVDTFCIHTRQAQWEKRIPKTEWRNYLVNNFHYPIYDSIYKDIVFTFEQKDRKAFYISPHLGIPLRDIRFHFKLKSTFFSVHPEGQMVVLKGRGFGHGVGLCQEGAMGMANKGLSYKQILSFYFEGITFEHRFENLYFNQRVFDGYEVLDFD